MHIGVNPTKLLLHVIEEGVDFYRMCRLSHCSVRPELPQPLPRGWRMASKRQLMSLGCQLCGQCAADATADSADYDYFWRRCFPCQPIAGGAQTLQ